MRWDKIIAGFAAAVDPHQRDMSTPAFAVGLFSIVALGCAIRFYGLSEPPIWMDEAYSYFVSGRPLKDILFNKVDNHPPLFYAVQHLWTLIDPKITAIRVPVAAIGSATVLIVALATSDLANRRAGLAAGAFLALSTSHIYFSQDARMYSQLAFGLALAIWGLLGVVDRNDRLPYLILYLIGGVIAIYSQVVALPCLAILNALALVCVLLKADRGRVLRSALAVNVVLLVASLPWLFSLPEAIETFQGLGQQSIKVTIRFVRGLIGFPGVPAPFRVVADAFMLLVYAIGGVFAWKSGRKTFAVIAFGMLTLYPLTLSALSLFAPILVSRVFIPCAIPASMLFGVALVSLSRPIMQAALVTAVLSLAVWSEVEAFQLRVKPEDMPQALALADAQGFAKAPILACYVLPAGTAYLYAADRDVVFLGARGDEFIRFNDRMLEAISLPLNERSRNGPLMRDFLLENDLVVDPKIAWTSVERVILITTNCYSNRIRFLEEFLAGLGFRKVDAPVLVRPTRNVIESLWTELSLWSRSTTRPPF